MSGRFTPFALALLASAVLPGPVKAQQVADTLFTPAVGAPVFKAGTGRAAAIIVIIAALS